MMRVWTAVAIVTLACWDAWRLLAIRIDDAPSAATVALLGIALAWRARGVGADAQVPPALPEVLLAGYALAAWCGPALLQIGAAVAGLILLLWHRARIAERGAVLGLALLALPVLPTLDFLLAFPLRRISAEISAALLRLNGVAVQVEGVALAWRGRLLLFDGPCSGVRMLWAALVLASLVALIERARAARYAGLLAAAGVVAILGNGLRAAGLFYLETGFASGWNGPVLHEAVGIAAFALVAAAIVAGMPRGRIAR